MGLNLHVWDFVSSFDFSVLFWFFVAQNGVQTIIGATCQKSVLVFFLPFCCWWSFIWITVPIFFVQFLFLFRFPFSFLFFFKTFPLSFLYNNYYCNNNNSN